MAKTKEVNKPSIRLTLTQQRVEDWINSQKDAGKHLLEMGLISQEIYDAGTCELADIKVRIEADDAVAKEFDADTNAAITKYEGEPTGQLGGTAGAQAALAEAEATEEDDDFDHSVDEDDLGDLLAMLFGDEKVTE